jgi:zinc transporter ZupT
MNDFDILALAFAFLLGLLHFFSDMIRLPEDGRKYRIISFAAGISIAYLFLDLLPHTYESAVHLKEWVFVFLLLGFALFHLVEKYIYQHADQNRLAKELKEVHSISFFFYYFLVGIVLEDKLQADVLEGTLFLIPVALHAGLSTASLSRIHGEIRERIWPKIALSSSSLLGVVFATLVPIPSLVDNILTSLIAGVLLYIIVKEFLPEKKKGQPLFFIFGIILFFAFILIITFTRN